MRCDSLVSFLYDSFQSPLGFRTDPIFAYMLRDSLSQQSATTHRLVRDTAKTKKTTLKLRVALVGLPGFEPRMTGPESVVLPLHHTPVFVRQRYEDFMNSKPDG